MTRYCRYEEHFELFQTNKIVSEIKSDTNKICDVGDVKGRRSHC